MKQVKSFGTLRPEYFLDEQVSISTDTTHFDSESKYKIFVQLEPPEVVNCLNDVITNQQHFDLILAWHKDILNNCPKAKRFIFGTCWIDVDTFVSDKQNEVSFLMSNKAFAPGHKFRHEIFRYLNKDTINGFSIRKIMTPPRIPNKDVIFKNAKFSIIVENAIHDNWITEKLIDCLVTNTIPIYYGCHNVGEFFNEKGILKFNTIGELDGILNTITPELYYELRDVISENHIKAKEYLDFQERVKNEVINLIKIGN